jgi:hypothetical protein
MFIIFNSDIGGLGDKLVGLASSWYLSKLLNCNLYIRDDKNIIKSMFDSNPKLEYNIFQIPDFNNKYDLSYGAGSKDFLNNVYNIINNKSKFQCIEIYANQNFYSVLYHKLNKIDILEEDVIRLTMDSLFQLKEHILSDYNKFKSIINRDINNEPYLGIHIRTAENYHTESFKIDNECINRFINTIRTSKYKNLLITTDNPNIKTIIENEFPDRKILYIDGYPHHVDKSSNIDYRKVVLDLFLLGECKEAIISYWSNFSRIGVLRTKIPFKIVNLSIYPNQWYDEVKNKPEKEWFNLSDNISNQRYGIFSEILSKEDLHLI